MECGFFYELVFMHYFKHVGAFVQVIDIQINLFLGDSLQAMNNRTIIEMGIDFFMVLYLKGTLIFR